jgi:hypothetical protein
MTSAATAAARKIKATTVQQANSWGCVKYLYSLSPPCYYDIKSTAITALTAARRKATATEAETATTKIPFKK